MHKQTTFCLIAFLLQIQGVRKLKMKPKQFYNRLSTTTLKDYLLLKAKKSKSSYSEETLPLQFQFKQEIT